MISLKTAMISTMDKTTRLAALERQITRLDRQFKVLQLLSRRIANLRLAVMGIGFGFMVFFALQGVPWIAWGAFLLAACVFAVLVNWHRNITRRMSEFAGWKMIKQSHVARLNLDWSSIPPIPLEADATHPFEIDLDLLVLNRLINTATTFEGASRLKSWLLNLHPDLQVLAKRQSQVKELIPLVTFRDKLTLRARLASSEIAWEAEQLLKWLSQEEASLPRWLLPILTGLSIASILLFGLFSLGVLPAVWVLTWFPYIALTLFYDRGLFQEALALQSGLRKLNTVLVYLEEDRYAKRPHLKALVAPILANKPSQYLRGINVTVSAASVQQNQILGPLLNAIVPWDIFFAERLTRQKAAVAKQLPTWLGIWFELEALNSLANFAYLNPAYRFPNLETEVIFEAQALGHPLLAEDTKVSNNFALDHIGQTIIITGSNMAGKSSFLRAVGVNLCLAYAGSVVDAETLTIGFFRVFTCIRVTDSLNDGISYFYAEVRRLRDLLEAFKAEDKLPLFFLIDEIFRGTNNQERLIGSRSYIQALAGGNAVGLIATHDLELVRLADENPNIQNYHFREEVIEGRMVFDYTLRSGPSPTTNALKIMRMEGLPVPQEELP
jgi:hypothetical protein